MSSRGGQKPTKMRPVSNAPKMINPYREKPKGAEHMRDRATIKRLAMYNTRAKYNREGQFMGGAFMNREVDEPVKRVAPDRRWFGNTRVIGQKDLEKFREQMNMKMKDPYTVVLHQQKLPMALLNDPYQKARADLLSAQTFDDTFGPKSQRKRPQLPENVADIEAVADSVETKKYDSGKDEQSAVFVKDYMKDDALETVFKKGTSRRIWNELYKVIDSSDVLVQVLDVRDPMGTRCKRIEDELRKPDRRHKHLILVLNKCDLVPTWVTRRWVKLLSREYPTLAFHASITNPFGKGSLLSLLRQFGKLHSDKKQISVGFVGYPNVGKSSVINSVKGDNVCPSAPVPGETKTWRYITLFKRIFLIDCPGVVYPFGNTPTDCVLKGVVRMELIESPEDYIGAVLDRVRPQYIKQHYGIAQWEDSLDFLKQLARRSGKLLKGGDPDLTNAARMVLSDWQLGRLPYFICPPFEDDNGGTGLFDVDKLKSAAQQQQQQQQQQQEGQKSKVSVVGDDDEDEEEDEEEGDADADGGKGDDDEDEVFDEDDEDELEWDEDDSDEDGEGEGEIFDEFGDLEQKLEEAKYRADVLKKHEKLLEMKRQKKNKTKELNVNKKSKATPISTKLEVDEQDLGTLAVRSRYASMDMDERLYLAALKESQSKESQSKSTATSLSTTTTGVAAPTVGSKRKATQSQSVEQSSSVEDSNKKSKTVAGEETGGDDQEAEEKDEGVTVDAEKQMINSLFNIVPESKGKMTKRDIRSRDERQAKGIAATSVLIVKNVLPTSTTTAANTTSSTSTDKPSDKNKSSTKGDGKAKGGKKR